MTTLKIIPSISDLQFWLGLRSGRVFYFGREHGMRNFRSLY